MNPVTMNQNSGDYHSESEDDDDDEDDDEDEEVQCGFCGIGILSEEEQNHINIMHKEEDEALGQVEAPVYTAPKKENPVYRTPKYEAPDANELRKLKREFRDMNGAMNDFSNSTVKKIGKLKQDISQITSHTQKVVNDIDSEVQEVCTKIETDFAKMIENVNSIDKNINKVEESVTNHAEVITANQDKLMDFGEKLGCLNLNEVNLDKNMDSIAEALKELINSKEEENKEMSMKIETMEELVNTMQEKLLNKIKTGRDIEDLRARVDKETAIVEDARGLMEQLSQKNIQSLLNKPGVTITFDKIDLETEEENEKFISETDKKDIEIKIEIPTAPSEEEINEDKIIEKDEPELTFKETMIKTEAFIKETMINTAAFIKEQESKKQQYERINAHNDRVMAKWYTQCANKGLIPKEFNLSNRDNVSYETEDDSTNEIKVENINIATVN